MCTVRRDNCSPRNVVEEKAVSSGPSRVASDQSNALRDCFVTFLAVHLVALCTDAASFATSDSDHRRKPRRRRRQLTRFQLASCSRLRPVSSRRNWNRSAPAYFGQTHIRDSEAMRHFGDRRFPYEAMEHFADEVTRTARGQRRIRQGSSAVGCTS